ncbi:MAG: DUF2270 domain-containing protein [Candidatus Binatia bacterium]|nr:DUF2270 domain-containing protein [Candidatus Binatia bacterium]
MTSNEPYAKDRAMILTHYYRAMVGRADTWRMRMDATTNWAIVTTAAVISFALGNGAVPHYGIFIASLMTMTFLVLEARRLTFYHLWQQRVLLIEKGMIRPALFAGAPEDLPASTMGDDEFRRALDPHLGCTIPTMRLSKAAARRMRRVYIYLFGVQLIAWMLKLVSDPTPATSFSQITDRAHVAGLPGIALFAIVGGCFATAVIVAVTQGRRDRKPHTAAS